MKLARRHLLQATAMAWGLPMLARAQAQAAMLTVSGPGQAGKAFDMDALAKMPQHHQTNETPWYNKARKFSGPLLRDVLNAAAVKGKLIRAVALNDYRVDIPFEDAFAHDVIVARLLDDQPMAVRDKGPLFVMYPFSTKPELRKPIYFSRCAWQLKALEIS